MLMGNDMPDYKEISPPIECSFCRETNDTVRVYRQRTMYVDPESNYVAACPECEQENNAYWDDMWAEYYRNCM